MNLVAIKMLVGDRAKYLGIIMGLTFASLLITQQLAIFCGLMARSYGALTDLSPPDSWVMDSKVQFIDDVKRVDTRVLQGLYSFDPKSLPVYVGQQMDVFIEAAPIRPAAVLSYTQTPG